MRTLACIPLLFLILLLISSLWLPLDVVHASTDIKGTIQSNTTWTSSGSPYSLSAPVEVPSGVTLTVQPGATILLNGLTLTVDGTLIANQVTIDGGYVARQPVFGSSEHTGSIGFTKTSTGSSIENSKLNSPVVSVDGNLKFRNNFFSGEGLVILSGSPEISKNTFSDGSIWVEKGSPLISENIIQHQGNWGVAIDVSGGSPQIISNILYVGFQGIFLNGLGDATISNNIVANFSEGVVGGVQGKLTIEGNLVMNNHDGVYVSSASIQHNTFAFNYVAINSSLSPSTISYNNIESSNVKSVSIGSSSNIDAINNWWGTTDTQAISNSIYDKNDYYDLGTVNFTPYLAYPDSQAPPVSDFSTVGPLPSVNPATPNQSQNLTPTETQTQTSAPTITFTLGSDALWSIIAVLSIVIVALALALVIILMRRPHT